MDVTVDEIKSRIESMQKDLTEVTNKQKELQYQILVNKIVTRILEDTISLIDKKTGQVLAVTDL